MKKLNILHLEDLSSDAELVQRELMKGCVDCEIFLVSTKAAFIEALAQYPADIILSDHSLPSMNSWEALTLVKQHNLTVPFILITATISEEYAVDIMKMGAYDYVLKDRLQRLPHAIEMAIEKWNDEREKEKYLEELVKNEQKFRGLIENGNDIITVWDEALNITYRSPNYKRITGWEPSDLLPSFSENLAHPEDRLYLKDKFEQVLKSVGIGITVNFRAKNKNGEYRWLEGVITNLLHDSSIKGIVSNFRDVTEKRIAEEQLQQSRYLLTKATEVAHIGYFTADANTLHGFWSDEVCRIYGIEPGTFDGSMETFIKFIYEKDRDEVLKKINNALLGKAPYKLDHRIVRPDGTIRWVHHTGEVSFSENGKPEKVIGITQEVTEQKTIEEILREYNDRFEIVSKATNDAIWDWDIKKDIILWNHGIQTIFGYELNQIESTNTWWADKLHPADHERVLKELSDLFGKRESNWNSQYQYRCFNGEYKHVLDRAYVIYQDDEPIRMIGAMQDITEQKAFEVKLTSIARELGNLIENANVPIFGIDRNGDINEWNKVATQLSAYAKDEVLGKKWIDMIDPIMHSKVNEIITEVMKGESVSNYELPFTSKNGKRLILLISISPRRDVHNNIIGLIFLAQDITEVTLYRRDLEKLVKERTEELNTALQKEKELVEMKSKFVSIASHEFRTPLSTISLATGFLRKYKSKLDTAEVDKKLEQIEKQVQQMVYLLDDVLLVGKADAGKIHTNMTAVETGFFKTLAQEVVKSTGKKHKLIFAEKCHVKSIITDEKLIRNIIINLITNAIKFSPDAGKINMNIECSETMFILNVQDFGIGIPEEEFKNLFQSFSRASNVSTIEGTGLGLSIVKKAVDLLKGTIDVKSELNKGTTFSVIIPLEHG